MKKTFISLSVCASLVITLFVISLTAYAQSMQEKMDALCAEEGICPQKQSDIFSQDAQKKELLELTQDKADIFSEGQDVPQEKKKVEPVPQKQPVTHEYIIGESLVHQTAIVDPEVLKVEIVADSYIVGPGDVLRVDIWKSKQINNRFTVDVLPEGRVVVPYVGEFDTTGLTLKEIAKRIKAKADKQYPKYETSVSIAKLRTFRVTVLGAVENPGVYRVASVTTVSEALSLAGGTNERGSLRTIELKHRNGKIDKIDLFRFFDTGDQDFNPTLTNGDTIFVPIRYATVRVRGEAFRPGLYEILKGETICDLIGFIHGTTVKAFKENVEYRTVNTGSDVKTAMTARFIDISDLSGVTGKTEMKDGDELNIYDRSKLISGKVKVTGSVRYPGEYENADGMTMRDLIFMAGNLTEKAYLDSAVLKRFDVKAQSYVKIPLSLRKVMEGDATQNIPVNNGDILETSSIIEHMDMVTIIGQVNNPGTYPLLEGYKVYDLLRVSGGPILDYDDKSSPPKEPADLRRAFVRRLVNGNTEDIPVDLEKVWVKRDMSEDMELKNGDQVFLPTAMYYVNVSGQVSGPAFVPYAPKEKPAYYLARVKLSESADAKNLRIIRNGKKVGNFDSEVLPGDEISVPKGRMNRLIETSNILRDWFGFFVYLEAIND